MDIEALKAEVDRLSRELDQTQSEKVQAAKYGMSLLEENSKLTQRCTELEEIYEVTKGELDITKSALGKVYETHKITEISGLQHEESLLSESAALESSLNSQILDLEGEVRLSKQELGELKYQQCTVETVVPLHENIVQINIHRKGRVQTVLPYVSSLYTTRVL